MAYTNKTASRSVEVITAERSLEQKGLQTGDQTNRRMTLKQHCQAVHSAFGKAQLPMTDSLKEGAARWLVAADSVCADLTYQQRGHTPGNFFYFLKV